MLSANHAALWKPDEVGDQMVAAVRTSYSRLAKEPNFAKNWTANRKLAGTKTTYQQSVLLGKGANGREFGAFWGFGEQYVIAECNAPAKVLRDRCCFERYSDFQFYDSGQWCQGMKRILVIAEAETNAHELLGELSALLAIRCPFKFLFITEAYDTKQRLDAFCADPTSTATDWGDTTYWVVEVPEKHCDPTKWRTHRADVKEHGQALQFNTIAI
jgi:hypothetical protein